MGRATDYATWLAAAQEHDLCIGKGNGRHDAGADDDDVIESQT